MSPVVNGKGSKGHVSGQQRRPDGEGIGVDIKDKKNNESQRGGMRTNLQICKCCSVDSDEKTVTAKCAITLKPFQARVK